jgi:hypothetical protein
MSNWWLQWAERIALLLAEWWLRARPNGGGQDTAPEERPAEPRPDGSEPDAETPR